MIFRLGCLFVLLPILDLALLFGVGQRIGLWPTIGLVVGAGFLGSALVRREGLRVLMAVQAETARGRVPARELMEGAAVLLGGALLLTPGILTDLAGLGLLLPPTRRVLVGWARRSLGRAIERGTLRVAVWSPGSPGTTGTDPATGPGRPGAEGRKGEIIQE